LYPDKILDLLAKTFFPCIFNYYFIKSPLCDIANYSLVLFLFVLLTKLTNIKIVTFRNNNNNS